METAILQAVCEDIALLGSYGCSQPAGRQFAFLDLGLYMHIQIYTGFAFGINFSDFILMNFFHIFLYFIYILYFMLFYRA
jgi:hypothetical protein